MMGKTLAKYVKAPVETKQYSIDYSVWLNTGETISSVSYLIIPTGTLAVAGSLIAADNKSISFFVSGGDDGVTYELLVIVTTSSGQTKEDAVLFVVRAL
jgi:hypothetical protein